MIVQNIGNILHPDGLFNFPTDHFSFPESKKGMQPQKIIRIQLAPTDFRMMNFFDIFIPAALDNLYFCYMFYYG